MDASNVPWRLLGLTITLLSIAGFFYWMYGKPATQTASGVPSELAAELGDAPPKNVAHDPRAAERFTRQQTCLAACAATARTCEATAVEEDQEQRCAGEKTRCDRSCQ